MAEKEATERRVYVLPKELLDRIRGYQSRNGIGAEVEAVRRLLDTALQMRDTVHDILNKLKSKFAEEKDLRVLAREVLAGHILVREVRFEDRAVMFTLGGDMIGRIEDDGRIFTGYDWERWSEVGAAQPAKGGGRPSGGPTWDAPKGGDLDDEIPF